MKNNIYKEMLSQIHLQVSETCSYKEYFIELLLSAVKCSQHLMKLIELRKIFSQTLNEKYILENLNTIFMAILEGFLIEVFL